MGKLNGVGGFDSDAEIFQPSYFCSIVFIHFIYSSKLLSKQNEERNQTTLCWC